MKTFKQYLLEVKAESAADMIRRDCGPFLEQSQGKGFLFRGIKDVGRLEPDIALDADGNEMEYVVKTVRQDRRPLDTSREWSRIIDDWFNEKFGFRARSQCLFAFGGTVNMGAISHYGDPCIIFPIGEMEYVWSPKVEDLQTQLDADGDDLEASIHAWLKAQGYKATGLEKAVKKRHEVMVKCGSYYAFPVEYYKQLSKTLGIK